MTRETLAIVVLGLFAGFTVTVTAVTPAKAAADTNLVERFLTPTGPELVSYRARRTLTASSMGGRMSATVEAWTQLDGAGRFTFSVISETGSGLIRGRVLLKALETEQQAHNEQTVSQTELTPDNYVFIPDSAATGDEARILLQPRRRSRMLLTGAVTVRRTDGDLIRLEGQPVESPSWWTKRVDISRRYTRINGVRVPVEMSSRADVRIGGESSFTMTYEYAVINGSAVVE